MAALRNEFITITLGMVYYIVSNEITPFPRDVEKEAERERVFSEAIEVCVSKENIKYHQQQE